MIGADTLPIMANARMHDVVGKWSSLTYSLKVREVATSIFQCSFSVVLVNKLRV